MVGAADLRQFCEALDLCGQSLLHFLKGGQKFVVDFLDGGDVHRRGEGGVRRLAHVHVIVRVNGFLRAHLATQFLDGPVRDHFVCVHVRLGAGAGLPDDQREVVVELAAKHLIGGGKDGLSQTML